MGAATTPLCASADQSFLTVVGAIGFEISLSGAFEDEISRGAECSAVGDGWTIDTPDFFLLHGIPGGKMAFSGVEDSFLDLRLLRQAGSRKVDADVKAKCFLLEMFFDL